MIIGDDIELVLKQRPDRTRYVEVWVRSKTNPRSRFGSPVEFDRDISKKLPLVAAFMAEEFCQRHGNDHDPGEMEKAARNALRELLVLNPLPGFGNELPYN